MVVQLLPPGSAALAPAPWGHPCPPVCLHELFEARASTDPEAPAVVCGERTVSYGELEARSNRLAHRLAALGVGPEVVAGIHLRRDLDAVVAILAVLKAGGAYLPLDPALPAERLEFLLRDAGPAVLVTRGAVPVAVPDTLRLLRLDEPLGEFPEGRLRSGVRDENLAYVIYTSGSTGLPKGVGVEHRSATHVVRHAAWLLGLEPGKRVTQVFSLSFDPSVKELFATLSAGATLVMADTEVVMDGERLAGLLRRERVTCLGILPSILAQVELEDPAASFPDLETVMYGGEVCPPELAARWSRGIRLINFYGPTEATIEATFMPWEGGTEGSPPIGRPLPGYRLEVLDESLRVVRPTVVGELGIAGVGLSRGYLGRPALTAERFVPDPAAEAPGERLYRTGDLGRQLEDSVLDFLGRVDRQIKIRGFRVEPGEVEARLRSATGLGEVVVAARGRPRRLVAYLVTAEGEPWIDEAAVQARLARELPSYMVPSAFVALPRLPRTATGKVDLDALPDPGAGRLRQAVAVPRDPREESLAAVFCEVLEAPAVGGDDDFFALGGNSLLATKVTSRAGRLFGVELPVSALFEAPTPAGLLRQVDAAAGRKPLPPIEVERRPADGVPLSYAQQRLWLVERLIGGTARYVTPLAWDLEGPLDTGALHAALAEVLRRHEALRTVFPQHGGRAVQEVRPPAVFRLPLVDLSGLPDASAELARLAGAEALRPFDLERGPLVRPSLVRLGEERFSLFVSMHHIVTDDFSIDLFQRELAALYAAALAAEPSPLEEPALQYADFTLWQRRVLEGDAFRYQLAWWEGRLRDVHETELPTDRPRSRLPAGNARGTWLRLPERLAGSLDELSRGRGATLFMTLLTAFYVLLQRQTGEADLVVGSPIANRNRPETEGLMGFFVNTLALRCRFPSDPTFGELLGEVRSEALGAYAHQDLPFERLVEHLAPERDAARNPFFQVVFALQNAAQGELALTGLSCRAREEQMVSVRFDLEVHFWQRPEGLHGVFLYDRDLFDATTMRRFAVHYRHLLDAVAADPGCPVSALTALSAGERHQLVTEWNDAATAYPREARLEELFAATAARHAEAAALVFDDAELTYRELDRRSNRLAHLLRRRGCRPGSTVGLCLERSARLVVATLAVIKAGGAYVPLDTEYPKSRLAFMIEDSAMPVLVTERRSARQLLDLPVERIDLDEPELLDGLPETAPHSTGTADGLAYVIYTSGSTGRAKGVGTPHRAVVRLVRDTDYVQLGPGERVAQASSASFDAATFEIWGALLNGACLVGVPKERLLQASHLARALETGRITALFVTTALFNQLAQDAPEVLRGLKHLLFGGEASDPGRVRQLLAGGFPGRRFAGRLLHVYGPTECTTYATWHRVREVAADAPTVAIGLPIANTTAYVLGRRLEPVPAGAPGELLLGGSGVAWGYLGRPGLSAERFVPDAYGEGGGGRLYRTGDVVRRRPDGALEFLSRVDHQVKLRGFRIELGEVEAALTDMPTVAGAAVQLAEDGRGGRFLVAYVVPDSASLKNLRTDSEDEDEPTWESALVSSTTDPWHNEKVVEWEMIFDDLYRTGGAEEEVDPTFDVVGWRSTYTGLPIPAPEMREWLDDTIAAIRSLRPRRVLEIGCGTGMLLYRLAPDAERYLGADISHQVLADLKTRLTEIPGSWDHVELVEAPAHELRLFREARDTVVLNSVVQYFPSVDYLREVLTGAVLSIAQASEAHGAVFVGDVRSLPLQELFQTSLELHRAEDDCPLVELRHRVLAGLAEQDELIVDPAFFFALAQERPEIRRVRILPKRGRAQNELTRFRYQVILEIGPRGEEPARLTWQSWRGWDLERLRAYLAGDEEPLALTGIPNARLAEMLATAELLAEPHGLHNAVDLRAAVAATDGPESWHGEPGVDPEDLFELAAGHGWEAELSWASPGADGRLDVVMYRRGAAPRGRVDFPAPPVPSGRRRWTLLGSDPLRGKLTRRLLPALRAGLGEKLPVYMVPSAWVVLDALPLNANGKLDRSRLPPPERLHPEHDSGYEPPTSVTEVALAEVFADVLGLERVGRHDDFFELGGHSLLATRVVSRIRVSFELDLELRAVFEAPTLFELAGRVDAARAAAGTAAGSAVPRLRPMPRDGVLPLSFAQQRLWFLEQLAPENPFYNSAVGWWLHGRLDAAALAASLREVVRRHEVLRTIYRRSGAGEPVQEVRVRSLDAVPWVDLRGLPEARRRTEGERLAIAEGLRLFDLERDLMMRATLLRFAEEEHRLLLTLHHVASDGWSWGVVLNEIEALYPAALAGRASPLGELAVQYADFALWQRGWLRGNVLAAELDFWHRNLDGAPLLELPADHPRPPFQRFRGGVTEARLAARETAVLEEAGREASATLFMTLLAAFDGLLWRHTGQHDLVVGTPVANRRHAGLEEMIGFFVNSLVLRNRLDGGGDTPFGDHLAAVRETALAAFAHQDVPFEKLVEHLHPERDLSRNPIFQVLFAVQNAPAPAIDLPGLVLEVPLVETPTTRFDLEVHVWQDAEGLRILFCYDRDLFEATTVERMVRRYDRLLKALAEDPARRFAELPFLGDGERQQLLLEWRDGGTTEGGTPDAGLDVLFREQAARTPEAVALLGDGFEVRYGELDRRSDALARRLRALGCGPEVVVGLVADRSPETVTALLAVMKAGGACLPLDPSYPAERLAFQLTDAAVPLVLARGELASAVPETTARIVRIDAEEETEGAALPAFPSDRLAYVLYTSGSTGRPKGVAMPHRPLAGLVRWQIRRSAAPRRTLQLAPWGFDVSFQETFATLAAGGTLVLLDEATRRDPARLLAYLRAHRVERLFLPFVALRQLAEAAAVRGDEELPPLAEVVTAGEQLQVGEALRRFCERLAARRPDFRLDNQYGPTEAHVVSAEALTPPATGWPALPAIGRPIAGGSLLVLSPDLHPVPAGAYGEVLIGGGCPARGYLSRPAMTAERFVPDPWGRGGRLYRTGDLGRHLPDGRIEFRGRSDQQLKVRGFRIEPGEVEAVLDAHPAVRQAAVTAFGTETLVAYVAAEGLADPRRELEEHLRRRLPEHMVPGFWVTLDELPRTPSGKVDRRALPAPDRGAGSARPRTPEEEVIANLWCEVLELESVGVDDDFFDLGGHSLLATRLVTRIAHELSVELGVRAVFEAPSVAGLARRLREERAPRRRPPIVPVERTGAGLPLSFAQQRLWFLAHLTPENPFYNLAAKYRIDGTLDAAVLRRALEEIVRRHEVLRTVYHTEGAEPVQVPRPEVAVALPVVDLAGLPPEARHRAAARQAREEEVHPFDLAADPMLRGRLLRLAPSRHRLLLTLHHVASDGWSWAILHEELKALYEAYAGGGEPALGELPVQYADFAVWQRGELRGEILDALLAHWRGVLSGAAALELPADRPRPAFQRFRGGLHERALDPELRTALQGFARRRHATLFMTAKAAFDVLLWRSTGQNDLLTGTPIANRNQAGVERLVGFFVNTLVLRTRLDDGGATTAARLTAAVRESALDAYAHQDLPFEKLVEDLHPERDTSRNPIFQVLFAVQNVFQPLTEMGGLELRTVADEGHTTRFDLEVHLEERPEGLGLVLAYDHDLFDATTVIRLADRYVRLLAALPGVAEETPVRELPWLSDAERHQLTREWQDAPGDGTAGGHLVRLFEAQVARRGEAIAVVDGAVALTYAELNARANRMARRLLALGAGPERLVALRLERSAEMVVALLATLKTGAAYLPIDPDVPPARLAHVLADATPAVVWDGAPELHDGLERLPEHNLDDAERRSPLLPGHAAYVIYTSGSTGLPKGVVVTHHNVTRLFETSRRLFRFGEDDVWTLFHSYTFDFSVWELWGPLLHGGRLVVVPKMVARSPSELLALLVEQEVTVLNQTPSAFYQLQETEAAEAELGARLKLRDVIFGGEALDLGRLEGWYRRHADDAPRLVNMYGITETTVHVTHLALGRGLCRRPGGSRIGRSLPDLRVELLDAGLEPVPVGVRGEIYVAGEGLARGYLGRAALTAERFVPDPWARRPGERLYRSGDLARRLGDGSLEYLGRGDQQVKIRGFRIELGEIEAVLARRGEVRRALVLEREGTLVAYVVAEGLAEWPEALARLAREHLPDYMVPSFWVRLDAVPLTPNGKVDRAALPAPERRSGGHAAPKSPEEEAVAAVFCQVLGLERIGADEDFFELGGHSLLATQVAVRVERELGAAVGVRAIFEAPTVAGLARRIRERRSPVARAPIRPVRRIAGGLPLSFAQQRLWFLERLTPGNPFYNMAADYSVEGPLAAAALRATLEEVVRRHEVLRTVYQAEGAGPVQVPCPEVAVALPVVDLAGLPPEARRRAASRQAREEQRRPFDLGADPMLRGRLLRLGPSRHRLLLTLHHIASDGWSWSILHEELKALYEAHTGGGPALAELPFQYADFAVWQREQLRGEALDALLGYWRAALAGAPALDLPVDRPRPAVQRFRGGLHERTLPSGLPEALREVGRRSSATLFMTAKAAFDVLLWRSTGQDDLLAGTPIANRNQAGVERLIGFFVNSLVLRTRLEDGGATTVARLLSAVRESALDAYAHQDLPFEKLVEDLHPERDTSRNPIFQVLFAVQNVFQPLTEMGGLELRAVADEGHTTRFDLEVQLEERPEGLGLVLAYDRDLFDATTVARLADRYARVLAALAAAPEETAIRELAWLSDAERHQLAREWQDFPFGGETAGGHLAHLFEAQAAFRGEATALVDGEAAISYTELNARANRLARRLLAFGAGPERLVALRLERSAEMVVALLAVLKTGAAYLPIDPDAPPARLAQVLGDASPVVLVSDRDGGEGLPVLRLDAPRVREEIAVLADGDLGDGERLAFLGDRHAAYVIYTSGSTGRPKGVVITHRNVTRLFETTRHFYGFGPDDVWPLFHSYAFDVSVWELWGAFLHGGRLIVVSKMLARSPAELLALLVEQGVTVFNQTPSAFYQFLEADEADPELGARLRLRHVVFAGEALDLGRLESWYRRHPDDRPRLVNMYGITETTVHSSFLALDRELCRRAAGSLVGRSLPDLRLELLDAGLEPVPLGGRGEIFVAGAGLARGYFNRPALTAQRFLPDPAARWPGARLYRSGDLARWRRDAGLEYLGRGDHQVKVRGFRIELGEIEAVLSRPAEVRRVLVLPREGSLVAYVEAEGLAEWPEALVRLAREHLPDYMVPGFWVRLDEFPLTPNGKVDRAALPAPERRRGENVAPRSPEEELIASVWCEVLEVESVGVEDDFFDLGGHSLLATQVVIRVSTAFDVDLPVREVFESPTVAGLAAAVGRLRSGVPPAPPILRRDRALGRYPASFSQLREWILDRLEPGTAAYNVPAAFRLRGPLDAAALARAFEEIQLRHAILRTTFELEETEPVQVVAPRPLGGVPHVELQGLPDGRREREVRRLVREEATRPFDLARGPLVRLWRLTLAENETVLLLTFHHITTDGWSQGIFFRELATLYEAFRDGQPSPLKELELQYFDFAAWQREWLRDEVLERLIAYWKDRLAGAPPTSDLPLDRPRPAVRAPRGAVRRLALDAEAATAAGALAKSERASLFMVLLTGLKTLLYRLSGQDDLTLGTFIANRNHRQTAELLGFFINTLALRTRLRGAGPAAEALRQVRETALGAYAHQDLPFEKLLDHLDLERNPAFTPLFQVHLMLQNFPGRPPALPGVELSYAGELQPVVDFDLELVLFPDGDAFYGYLRYDRTLFDATTVERLVRSWRSLLIGLGTTPDALLDELPLLSAAERHQVVVEHNDTAPEWTAETLHGPFERLAAADPEALAVLDAEGVGLTYGVLDARAGRLAAELRRRGVGAESVVGVAVERSLGMVVALFGVLKAGGAFLPLDAEQPEERLRFLLADAGVRRVVTHGEPARRLASLARNAGVELVDLDAVAEDGPPVPAAEVHPDQAAYVLYTSGSTGEPKGVVISHRAAASFIRAAIEIYDVTARDRILQFAALTFDTSIEEVFSVLSVGAALVLRSAGRLETPEELLRRCSEDGVTWLDLPTAYWHEMTGAPRMVLPPSLRLVLLGGERAEASALKAWQERIDRPVRLMNAYGPTETTVIVTCTDVPPGLAEIPIGRPIPGARVHLLDPRLRPVPPGARGQIAIAGAGLARGYLGRPAWTAERFVPDPHGGPGDRLYQTGDLGRRRGDGVLHFAGRVDDQVKLRGLRVEPGEVATVLGRHPALEQALVLARTLPSGAEGLVAFVVPSTADVEELRRYAAERLPPYMVPAAFVVLDALPRTSRNKVDRAALARHSPEAGPGRRPSAAAPRNDTERRLVALWKEVLGVGDVGIEDSFFEAGGDSLLILRLHRLVESELGWKLKVLDLFRHPTVRSLAERFAGPGTAAPAARDLDRARQLAEKQKQARRGRRRPVRRGER